MLDLGRLLTGVRLGEEVATTLVLRVVVLMVVAFILGARFGHCRPFGPAPAARRAEGSAPSSGR